MEVYLVITAQTLAAMVKTKENVASALSAQASHALLKILVLVSIVTRVTWRIRQHIWILVVPIRNVAEIARLVFFNRTFVDMFLPVKLRIYP